MVKVSHLSSFLVASHIGHLEAAPSIFAYLQKHRDLALFFNPCKFDVDKLVFSPQNSGFFGNIEEDVPPNLPVPPGAVKYVDADHASNKVTWHSQTGFIIWKLSTTDLVLEKAEYY
jgi:hypothetical protein